MSKTTGQTDLRSGVEEDTTALSRDDLFEVLSNRRRRHVVHYLKQQPEGRAELSDVVEQIAAWENGTEKEQLTYDDRKSVHISLYQHHGPKMDEVGIIDYDQRAGVLALTGDAADLDPYLASDDENDRPWAVYFTLLSMTMGGIVLVGGLDLPPFTLPDIAWGAVVVTVFAVASLAFLYDTRFREADDENGPPPEVRLPDGA